MVRYLARLLHCWWTTDRIRTSPRAGRLLRLGPGSFLLLAGEAAQVVARRAAGGHVGYRCTTAGGDCEIRVSEGVVVVRGGAEQTLDPEQVEAIPGPSCSRPFDF